MRQLDRDRVLARRPTGKHFLPVRFKPSEKSRVADQAVFDDFGIAGAELARRKGIEQRRIRDHQDRLMEGADEILAMARIDRGLAANRRINLRKQRGRHLHVVEAAAHHGGGEAGKIADDAAAERDHEIAPLDARGDQRLANLLEHRKALGALPGCHDDARRLHAGGVERGSAASR